MTREQKIKLLHGIANGKRSISELEPTTYEAWMCTDGVTYFSPKTSERITVDEYKQRFPKSISLTLNIE